MSDDEETGVRVRTVLSAKELADDDTELWLVRVPINKFDTAILANAGTIKIDEGARPGTVLRVLDAGGTEGDGYELVAGEPSEAEAYQVLAQEEEEEEDEDEGAVLRIPKPFDRHFVVARRLPATPGRGDDEEEEEGNAAEKEDGDVVRPLPPPVVPLIVPYAPIAQVADLHGRFLPAGAGSAPPPPLGGGGAPEEGKKDNKRRLTEEGQDGSREGEKKKKKKDKK